MVEPVARVEGARHLVHQLQLVLGREGERRLHRRQRAANRPRPAHRIIVVEREEGAPHLARPRPPTVGARPAAGTASAVGAAEAGLTQAARRGRRASSTTGGRSARGVAPPSNRRCPRVPRPSPPHGVDEPRRRAARGVEGRTAALHRRRRERTRPARARRLVPVLVGHARAALRLEQRREEAALGEVARREDGAEFGEGRPVGERGARAAVAGARGGGVGAAAEGAQLGAALVGALARVEEEGRPPFAHGVEVRVAGGILCVLLRLDERL